MYMLGSCNILFQFVNKHYNAGVFFGDSFCPKGFVLLGGLQRYTWWALYSGAHYTQVNMVYLHITYKNCFPSLSGKNETVRKLSLTVFDNSKSLSSLDFIKCTTCRREKTPSFFDDSDENSRIIPSHLHCDISAKDC